MWPCWCIGWFDTVIGSCLVSSLYFNFIVQYYLYHNTDIGTLWYCTLPITVCCNGFGVCVVLAMSVIRCSCLYFLDRILLHHDFHHVIGLLMAIHYFLNYILGFLLLSSSGSANAQLPGCFHPAHSPWILEWTCYLRTPLCHVYIPYWDILQGVPGFATDCPCRVRCRGLSTCLLYVGPLFVNLVQMIVGL